MISVPSSKVYYYNICGIFFRCAKYTCNRHLSQKDETMNHFLIQKPDSSFLYLYHDKKSNTLSMQRYTQKGLGNHSVTVLRQNVEPDFSCAMAPEGNIHLAFSTTNGSIHYGHFSQNTFRSFPILTAKSPMPYPKHICILAQQDSVSIFYLVRHGEKHILSMQQVDNRESAFSSPIAIDYLWHAKQNFTACQAEDSTIFLAYSRALAETESGIHVIRSLDGNGTIIRQQEFLAECKEPLWIDHFSTDKKNALTVLAHPISYSALYFYTTEESALQSMDLTPYPRSQSTFFGLVPLQDGTHCYFCTDGILYDSIPEHDAAPVPFRKQPKQYTGSILPIYYITKDTQLLLPGTLSGRQFFYFRNPFSGERNPAEPTEATRLTQLEKRVSALERQLTRLEKDIKTPRDVVGRNFDT